MTSSPKHEKRKQVRLAVEQVNLVAQKLKNSHRRFANYRYLRAVLRCYSKLEADKLLITLKSVLDRDYGVPKAREYHAIRRIIEATATSGDAKMRSRWTRALEFSWNEEVEPKELKEFFEQHGGISGCARHAARALATRPISGWDDHGPNEREEYNAPRWEKEEWDRMKDHRGR